LPCSAARMMRPPLECPGAAAPSNENPIADVIRDRSERPLNNVFTP
jgi:hypothetical protein